MAGLMDPQWTPEWEPEWTPGSLTQVRSDLQELQGVDQQALQSYVDYRDFEPTGNMADADAAAQQFYTAVKGTPGAYDNLSMEEKMQYQWLRFQNGEISGNNKDDQIKKVRQEYGIKNDKSESRNIIRNKPNEEGRADGITPGDVFQIGYPTMHDTGKDAGAFMQLADKATPGLDLPEVLGDVAGFLEPITDVLSNKYVQVALMAAGGAGFMNSLATNGLQATLTAAASGELGSQGYAALDYLGKIPTITKGIDAVREQLPGPQNHPDYGTTVDPNAPRRPQSDGPMIGDTPVGNRVGWHWEYDPKTGTHKAVRDNPASDGGDEGSGVSPEDLWILRNGVLVNTTTGQTREAGGNMEEGVTYNGDGDVVGQEDPTKEDGGLLGDLGVLFGGIGTGVGDIFGEMDEGSLDDYLPGPTPAPVYQQPRDPIELLDLLYENAGDEELNLVDPFANRLTNPWNRPA